MEGDLLVWGWRYQLTEVSGTSIPDLGEKTLYLPGSDPTEPYLSSTHTRARSSST